MRFIVLLVSFAIPALANAAWAPKYKFESATVTDLGTLGGTNSAAYDINEGGDIAGMAYDTTQRPHAVAWFSGILTDLHDDTISWAEATAYGINDKRVIVGELTNPTYSHWRAVFWYPGIFLNIFDSYSPPGGLPFDWDNHAYAINNSGRVAGEAARIPNPERPPPPDTVDLCYESLPVMWVMATPDVQSLFCIADIGDDNVYGGEGINPAARDVNEAGNFVGTDGDTSRYSMFLFKGGVRISVPAPLGLADPSLDGSAEGLNDKNWVVGRYGEPGLNIRAFVWDGVSPRSTNIGTLAGGTRSWATEINEQNMVVGSSERGYGSGTSRIRRDAAFLWHSNFGMKQLPGLSGGLTFFEGRFIWVYEACWANSLNDRKAQSGLVQVVGECNINGVGHAVRWDVTVSIQPVYVATSPGS
jgi:uncharacterized membrane protein